MCGMEAALFVPSGTMSNAIAIRATHRPAMKLLWKEQVISISMKEAVMQLVWSISGFD